MYAQDLHAPLIALLDPAAHLTSLVLWASLKLQINFLHSTRVGRGDGHGAAKVEVRVRAACLMSDRGGGCSARVPVMLERSGCTRLAQAGVALMYTRYLSAQ